MHHIRRMKVQDFLCIRDLDLELTPLHALIGPNDSGKSTLLRAIGILMAIGSHNLRCENGTWTPLDPALLGGEYTLELDLSRDLGRYGVVAKGSPDSSESPKIQEMGAGVVAGELQDLPESPLGTSWSGNGFSLKKVPFLEGLTDGMMAFLQHGALLVHPNPDALRATSYLKKGSHSPHLTSPEGTGLATIYDAVMSRGDDAFSEIKQKVTKLFPQVKAISLPLVADGTKELQIVLKTGERVPARFLSEGLLYYLLFAALPYLAPKSVLLIEEPENGLHPARIREVMAVLKALSKTTQVIIATHSPLVINELEPEEVTLITRPDDRGTQATPMIRTKNFEERSKVYALGELWLSYADGDHENRLIKGGGHE